MANSAFLQRFCLILLCKVIVTSQQGYKSDFFFPNQDFSDRFGGIEPGNTNVVVPQPRHNPYAYNIFLQFNNFLNQPSTPSPSVRPQTPHLTTKPPTQNVVTSQSPKPLLPLKPLIPPQSTLQLTRVGDRISRKSEFNHQTDKSNDLTRSCLQNASSTLVSLTKSFNSHRSRSARRLKTYR